MAVLADIARVHVIRALTRRIDTVVAGETAARNISVIKNGRHPGPGLVTVVALITRVYVVGCLSDCLHTVVAGNTASGHGGMVHESNRAPGRGCVTVAAEFRGLNVIRGFRRRLNRADR